MFIVCVFWYQFENVDNKTWRKQIWLIKINYRNGLHPDRHINLKLLPFHFITQPCLKPVMMSYLVIIIVRLDYSKLGFSMLLLKTTEGTDSEFKIIIYFMLIYQKKRIIFEIYKYLSVWSVVVKLISIKWKIL